MSPAGTATLSILRVLLNEVASCGLLGLAPAPEAVNELSKGLAEYNRTPMAFHPGAKFLYDVDPIVLTIAENLKSYIGIFGGFCMSANLAVSITSARHLSKMITERRDVRWSSLGKYFARGVEATDEVVQAAARSVDAFAGDKIPDPSKDVEGYKAAVDPIYKQLLGLKISPAS